MTHNAIEKYFDELTKSEPVNFQTVYDKTMACVSMSIDNWAGRRANGQPAPLSELESILRTIAHLHHPCFDSLRNPHPDAGAMEIARILELARKDFGSVNEQTTDKKTKGRKGIFGSESESVKNCQNQTEKPTEGTDTPAGTRSRLATHGNVRFIRGGGTGDMPSDD